MCMKKQKAQQAKLDELYIADEDGNLKKVVELPGDESKIIRKVLAIAKIKLQNANQKVKKYYMFCNKPDEERMILYDTRIKLFIFNQAEDTLKKLKIIHSDKSTVKDLEQIYLPNGKSKFVDIINLKNIPEEKMSSSQVSESSSNTSWKYLFNGMDVEITSSIMEGRKLLFIDQHDECAIKFVNLYDRNGSIKKFIIVNTSVGTRGRISFFENSQVGPEQVNLGNFSSADAYTKELVLSPADIQSEDDLSDKISDYFDDILPAFGTQLKVVDEEGEAAVKFIVGSNTEKAAKNLIVNISKKPLKVYAYSSNSTKIFDELADILPAVPNKYESVKVFDDRRKLIYSDQPSGPVIKFITLTWPGKENTEMIIINRSEFATQEVVCVKQNGEDFKEVVVFDQSGILKSREVEVCYSGTKRTESFRLIQPGLYDKSVEVSNILTEVEDFVDSDGQSKGKEKAQFKVREKEDEITRNFRKKLFHIFDSEGVNARLVVFKPGGIPTDIITVTFKDGKIHLLARPPDPKLKDKLILSLRMRRAKTENAAAAKNEQGNQSAVKNDGNKLAGKNDTGNKSPIKTESSNQPVGKTDSPSQSVVNNQSVTQSAVKKDSASESLDKNDSTKMSADSKNSEHKKRKSEEEITKVDESTLKHRKQENVKKTGPKQQVNTNLLETCSESVKESARPAQKPPAILVSINIASKRISEVSEGEIQNANHIEREKKEKLEAFIKECNVGESNDRLSLHFQEKKVQLSDVAKSEGEQAACPTKGKQKPVYLTDSSVTIEKESTKIMETQIKEADACKDDISVSSSEEEAKEAPCMSQKGKNLSAHVLLVEEKQIISSPDIKKISGLGKKRKHSAVILEVNEELADTSEKNLSESSSVEEEPTAKSGLYKKKLIKSATSTDMANVTPKINYRESACGLQTKLLKSLKHDLEDSVETPQKKIKLEILTDTVRRFKENLLLQGQADMSSIVDKNEVVCEDFQDSAISRRLDQKTQSACCSKLPSSCKLSVPMAPEHMLKPGASDIQSLSLNSFQLQFGSNTMQPERHEVIDPKDVKGQPVTHANQNTIMFSENTQNMIEENFSCNKRRAVLSDHSSCDGKTPITSF